jgi:hypothetical protein
VPQRRAPTSPGAHHDPRTAEEFTAALWRETDASLRLDPERWVERRHGDLPSRNDSPYDPRVPTVPRALARAEREEEAP